MGNFPDPKKKKSYTYSSDCVKEGVKGKCLMWGAEKDYYTLTILLEKRAAGIRAYKR